MQFEPVHQDVGCALYPGYTLHVLANPTGDQKNDWWQGHLGITDCADCQAARELAPPDTDQSAIYCAACTTARDRRGRAAVAILGLSRMADFDFSTPEAALVSLARTDVPDDFMGWIYALPSAIWNARTEQLKKTLISPSPTAS